MSLVIDGMFDDGEHGQPGRRRRHGAEAPSPRGFRETLADLDRERRPVPLSERRRMALERLQVSTAPRRRRADAASVRQRAKIFDVPAGPAPVGFYVITLVVVLFVVLGLVMVLSASALTEVQRGNGAYDVFTRQATWAGIGLVGLLLTTRLNLVWVRRLAIPAMGFTTMAMALPFVPGVGSSVRGARAWVDIGPFSMQPSEFLKLAVVIFAADLLVRRQHELTDIKRGMRPLVLLVAVAAGASIVQSDLGSAIVIASIVLSVAFIGGVPLSPMIAATLAAGGAAVAFVVSSPYRMDRFTAFLDIAKYKQGEGYQMYQAQLAMVDGGFTGSGIGAGNGKLGYLPLAHSDFIFAVIADELGFVGAVAVVGGFAVLAWFGIQAALSSPDRFGMLVAGGISAWFGVQAVINMGGVVGLMPVTGLTLPFFSAGGSSLFISMTAAGLLLNVARRGGARTED